MRGLAAAGLIGLIGCAGGGCALVVASAGAVSSVTAATVKTAGKVTVAAVNTTGRVASAALNSGGEVTALSMESATQLAKNGMVVLVDGSSGATVELPWRQGMQLYATIKGQQADAPFRAAKIFRNGKQLGADLEKIRAGRSDLALWPRDVIELQP